MGRGRVHNGSPNPTITPEGKQQVGLKTLLSIFITFTPCLTFPIYHKGKDTGTWASPWMSPNPSYPAALPQISSGHFSCGGGGAYRSAPLCSSWVPSLITGDSSWVDRCSVQQPSLSYNALLLPCYSCWQPDCTGRRIIHTLLMVTNI